VHQPGYQLGATAARLLLERIDGLKQRPRKIVLATELKVRHSAAPPALGSGAADRKSRYADSVSLR
jgi:LacI family transcriptional regulator